MLSCQITLGIKVWKIVDELVNELEMKEKQNLTRELHVLVYETT
jgi:hypothetical protein